MKVCSSIVLNSDASENIDYNNPNFPVYIKKDSFQATLIIVLSVIGTMISNSF